MHEDEPAKPAPDKDAAATRSGDDDRNPPVVR
jgi:hypothetical protein